jgi:hypothetical protein
MPMEGKVRRKEKDSLDMFRLLEAIDTEDLTQGIHRHFADDQAGKALSQINFYI